CADRDATSDRTAHRAYDVQIVGCAVGRKPGALAFPFRRLGQLRADQVGQRQVFKEDLHELFLAQCKGEIVFAFARVAGLTLAGTTPATALGPLDPVATHVVFVAGVHDLPHAALAVVKHRLGDILLRDADFLAALDVADASTVDGALDRLANLVFVATQKPFAIADRLVLAGQPAVDDLEHENDPGCGCLSSAALAHPQVPLAQQAHLLGGIALVDHAIDEVFVLLGFVGTRL